VGGRRLIAIDNAIRATLQVRDMEENLRQKRRVNSESRSTMRMTIFLLEFLSAYRDEPEGRDA
jgi:hypothetical protein